MKPSLTITMGLPLSFVLGCGDDDTAENILDTGTDADSDGDADSDDDSGLNTDSSDTEIGGNPCGQNDLVAGDPITVNWAGTLGPITYEIAQCATTRENTSRRLQLVHMAAGVNTNFQVLRNLANSDYPTMGVLVGNSITLAEEFGDGGASTMSSSIDDNRLQSSPPPTLYIESISDEGSVVGCLYNMADYVSNIDTTVTIDGPLLFARD